MPGDQTRFDETKLDKAYDSRFLLRMLPFARPFKNQIIIAITLVILLTLLDLSLPYIIREGIDNYILPQSGTTETGHRNNVSEKIRHIQVDMSEPAVAAVVQRHPALFFQSGQTVLISLNDLENLSTSEIRIIRQRDLSGIAGLTLLFACLILLDFLFNFFQQIIMEYAAQNIMHGLRMTLFTHMLNLGMTYFTKNPAARLVTRATSDVQNLHELFTSIIIFVFKDLFLLTGIMVMMLIIDYKLALTSFVVLPGVVAAAIYFSRLAREAFRTLRVKTAEINTRFSETIAGIRVIQLFRQEENNYQKFAKINHDYYAAGMRQLHVFAIFMPVIEFLSIIATALIIYSGGIWVLSDAMTIGSLAAFISYIKMFFRPIRDIAEKYNILQNALSSAERLFQILDTREGMIETIPVSAGMPVSLDAIRDLEIDNVTFGYIPGERVLKQVSLSVKSGETLAIVGQTGSGKTTLINLLTRLYEPDSGSIRLNGIDIRRYSTDMLRSRIALVTQDPFLFSESVRDNILHGVPEKNDEDLHRITQASHLTSIIARLPDGLDTRLSEGGASISSGERQLISIARAFARNPDMIILDEATSYIDSETEQKIQQAIANLMAGRTAIVIAHRLITARSATQIVVLGNGRVVETGTHETLMAAKGYYYRLNQYKT